MPPLLDNKNPSSPSVFRPSSLLREARRQKRLVAAHVPAVCLLDPDGDMVRRLRREGLAHRFEDWPCYHTTLDTFTLAGRVVGIVGLAVGAPFAVLVAEQLFASGCRFLLSMTSAGQIVPARSPPYFVIIDRALRDEGTSYHYVAASDYSEADPQLIAIAIEALQGRNPIAIVGSSRTTDAPFRETAEAIEAARSRGVLAVEMEAAALYAFARAARVPILCLAHITNTMGQTELDFEKGEAHGTADALGVLGSIVERWNLSAQQSSCVDDTGHGQQG